MTERQIAEVLRAVPPLYGLWASHPHRNYVLPDYDAMARAVAERLTALGWVNLADPAVCHGGHAACVHVIEDMKVRDARLARLGEAVTHLECSLCRLGAGKKYICQRHGEELDAVIAALADAGAGKERGDGL